MIDLAFKMILDEKARFAATILGVGFASALIMIQLGLFFGLLENASITIDHLDAQLWVTARNSSNVDFGNPFPETYVQRIRSIPGVARADNLIVFYGIVSLPTGAKETIIYYGLDDFAAWNFPWDIVSGDPTDLRRGPYFMLDDSAERRFGPFQIGDYREVQGQRLKIIGRTKNALSFTTSPVAFLDYRLAQRLSPVELADRTTFVIVRLDPGANQNEVAAEISRRLPYNDVHTKTEWAAQSRSYWIESTGLGLTLLLTVALGGLVGVVIVAQTLYASTSEHLTEYGTVKALGGGNLTVCGIVAEQASFAAAFGYALGLALTFSLKPALATIDMKMIVSPTLTILVFMGTQALCLAAALFSFRKVATLDPAMVFRG
jgi:putative ABC transport system permease protein